MVKIELKTTLERFRQFIILNTCRSFIPPGYLKDPSIFPERDLSQGLIYVEAVSKIDLEKIRDIRFVKVAEVLGVIYRSKSGNTDLKWRQIKGVIGKVVGEASPNSIVNLIESGVLPKSSIKKMLEQFTQESVGGGNTDESALNNKSSSDSLRRELDN
jgi:hypothetical protein